MSAPAMAFPGLMHSPPESDEPRELTYEDLVMSFHFTDRPSYFAFYRHVPEMEAEQIRIGKLQGPVHRLCWCCGKTPENAALMATPTTVLCDNCWGAISPLI